MKDTEYFPSYNGTSYSGPAMKLGAGVQVEEAYTAARTHNNLVVGGDCATVGIAGGYLQGLFRLIIVPLRTIKFGRRRRHPGTSRAEKEGTPGEDFKKQTTSLP